MTQALWTVCLCLFPVLSHKTTTTDNDGDVDGCELDDDASEGTADDLRDAIVGAASCLLPPPLLVILPLWRSLVRLDGTTASTVAASDLEND